MRAAAAARPKPQRPTSSRLERAAAVAAMRQHRAMPETLHWLFSGVNGLIAGNIFINIIMSDRARMIMGWLTLFLDASHDPSDPLSGLTVNRFKALCARAGLSSPGRAAATLGLMRFAGYIEPATRASRGLPLRLVPTEKLMAPQRERLRLGLTALVRLSHPGGTIGLTQLNNPIFFRCMMRSLGEQFLGRERVIDHAPALAFFAERKGGLLTLVRLMLSAQPGDQFPPSGPISVSVKELARRGLIARAQVRELLRGGVEAGLLTAHASDGGSYQLTPELRADAANFIAATLLLVGDAALQAQSESAENVQPVDGVH